MHFNRFMKAGWAAGLALSMSATVVPIGAWADSIGDLRAEVETLRRRVAELEALVRNEVHSSPAVASAPADSRPRVRFGGQYRLNAYTADNDDGSGRQTAARLRIRQNLDFDFGERFTTHLQLELGHTDSNRTTTTRPVRVRHALMDYRFEKGLEVQAGIVPLSDRFGDSLFSSDWDYNPVALSATSPLWGGELRVFAANLLEGDEADPKDDFVHYQLDYLLPFSDRGTLNVGGTLATLEGLDGDQHIHANYGLGGSWQLTDELLLRGFLIGSHTSGDLIQGAEDDANGLAAKLELLADFGLGILATYATGDDDRSGFLPTMALAETYGYWGYTGLLTVQGATDTGFDGDAVNVSNNGFGLATVQLKYARPFTERFDIHLAGGWFGATDAPDGRGSFVGGDFLAMATYHINSFLDLDLGAAYARLGDGVSGYPRGLRSPVGGPPDAGAFNQLPGERRDKYVFFTRLQAEF